LAFGARRFAGDLYPGGHMMEGCRFPVGAVGPECGAQTRRVITMFSADLNGSPRWV
jgi:hypothetical protein